MTTKIIYQSFDWREFDINNKYTLISTGRTIDDKSVYVEITGYTPHFYILLPDNWSNHDTILLKQEIKYKCKDDYGNLKSVDIVQRHKFKGFTNNKIFNFLRLVFKTNRSMKNISTYLDGSHYINNRHIIFELYESNIDTALRFMHIKKIQSCDWIMIDEKDVKHSENSDCDISIECDWTKINSYSSQIDNNKNELNNMSAPFKICSFDLECTSGDGSFPQASRIEDKIIQIGSVFSKYGGEIYRKVIISLGSCDKIDNTEVIEVKTEKELLLTWADLIYNEDPDILTGYNIWGFDENYLRGRTQHIEIDCEKEFTTIISRKNNTMSKFVDKKLSSSGLGDNFLHYYDIIGRVQIDLMKEVQKNYKLNKYSLDSVSENFIRDKIIRYKIIDKNHLEIETKNLNTVIVGNYIKIISNMEMEYGLHENNDICEEDLEYDNIENKDENNNENEEQEYNYTDEKYKIIEINENNTKMIIENMDIEFTQEQMDGLGKDLNWGLVKDDVKANDIFRMFKEGPTERKIIAEYCIQDCVLVIRLLNKLEIITNNISMANVCYVPFYYLLIRGQGIKSLSLVSKVCREEGYLIPTIKKENVLDESYEGAIVFEPHIGFYQTYIVVKDFNSLYPSAIIAENISHETIVLDDQYDNLPEYNYNDVFYMNHKTNTEVRCRYAIRKDSKESNKIGILPKILKSLLDERKKTKKLMEKETDTFKKSILDGKQLALKVTANSLYGQLGASTSPICMKALAASTTASGRKMLELSRNFVQTMFPKITKELYEVYINNNIDKMNELIEEYIDNKYKNDETLTFIKETILMIYNDYTIEPKVIYGDTDSVFINMNIKDKKTNELLITKEGLDKAIKLGQLSSILIKNILVNPHNQEYEKTFYPFCLMAKKRYVGNKYEDNPKKFKQSSMGIVLKRRDNANIVKKVIGGLLNIMLNENNIDKTINYVKNSIRHICNNEEKDKNNNIIYKYYPISDFTTTKTLRAKYKGKKLTTDEYGPMGTENDEGWPWYDVKCAQSHVMLCQRMLKRDAGNAPNVNDRIPFVSIVVPNMNKNMLQGDMIEHIDYVKENKLKINYLYYLTNQIMKPAIQILELLIIGNEDKYNMEDIFKEVYRQEERQKGNNILKNKTIKLNNYSKNQDDKNNNNNNNNIFIDFEIPIFTQKAERNVVILNSEESIQEKKQIKNKNQKSKKKI